MDVGSIVGLVSGLLAIFTFATGITSARDLSRVGHRPAAGGTDRRSWFVLGLSAPAFAVSMYVTITQGLDGSDTGGAIFVLLLVGAVLLVHRALARRTARWPLFFLLCVVLLGAAGYLMGSMSRGEEAESATAGVLVGVAVGLLGLGVGRRGPTADPAPAPAPGNPDGSERTALRCAREHRGVVTATDVAIDTDLTVEQARAVLDRLAAAGHCHRVVVGGATRYRFPDLIR